MLIGYRTVIVSDSRYVLLCHGLLPLSRWEAEHKDIAGNGRREGERGGNCWLQTESWVLWTPVEMESAKAASFQQPSQGCGSSCEVPHTVTYEENEEKLKWLAFLIHSGQVSMWPYKCISGF